MGNLMQFLSFYVDTGFWNWLGITIGIATFSTAIRGFWTAFWSAMIVQAAKESNK